MRIDFCQFLCYCVVLTSPQGVHTSQNELLVNPNFTYKLIDPLPDFIIIVIKINDHTGIEAKEVSVFFSVRTSFIGNVRLWRQKIL